MFSNILTKVGKKHDFMQKITFLPLFGTFWSKFTTTTTKFCLNQKFENKRKKKKHS